MSTQPEAASGELACPCGSARVYAKPAEVPFCRDCWRADRIERGLICVEPGCTKAVESRGRCASHARRHQECSLVQLSGRADPVTGAPLGKAGRPKERRPGGQPGNTARSTGLSRWLKRGEIVSPAIRRDAADLGESLAASLGGVEYISAQERAVIEGVCAARVGLALALAEVQKFGAFGEREGTRVASAGLSMIPKFLAEARQGLSLLGMTRKAAPAQSVSEWLTVGDIEAPIPVEAVAVLEEGE